MTRDELLDALNAAPQGQFDFVVAKLAVPPEFLPGAQAPQATRAADMLRYVEQQGRLADLERALRSPPTAEPGAKLRKYRTWIAAAGVALLATGGLWRWLKLRHPPKGIELLWTPSDCEHKEPRIGYGSCNETRDLPWLQSQINGLRNARVHGFETLRLDPKLAAESYHQKENWLLYLTSGDDRFILGIGYDRDTRAKDGCLHLYDTRDLAFRSATVCLDTNGHWWASDGWLGTYRRIDPASIRSR